MGYLSNTQNSLLNLYNKSVYTICYPYCHFYNRNKSFLSNAMTSFPLQLV